MAEEASTTHAIPTAYGYAVSPEEAPMYTTLNPVDMSVWQDGQNHYYDPSDTPLSMMNSAFDDANISQFTEFTPDNSQSSDLTSYLDELFKSKDMPRELLVDQILQLTHNNATDLEHLRIALFKIATRKDDFPMKEGNLRRRLDARKVGAPSVQQKLAKDCFILLRACEGEFTEDLADVVPTKGKRPESTQGTKPDSGRPLEDAPGIKVLREQFAVMQRDLLDIKRCNSESSAKVIELTKTIDSLVKDKENAQTRAKKNQAEFKLFKTQLTKCEKDMVERNIKLKSVETTNFEIQKSLDERTIELNNMKEENECLEKKLNNTNKTLSETQNSVKKVQGDYERNASKARQEIRLINEQIGDCFQIAKRFDDSQSNGVAGTKKSVKLVSQRMSACEADIEKAVAAISGCKSAIDSVKDQCINIKRAIKEKMNRKMREVDDDATSSADAYNNNEHSDKTTQDTATSATSSEGSGTSRPIQLINRYAPLVIDEDTPTNQNDTTQHHEDNTGICSTLWSEKVKTTVDVREPRNILNPREVHETSTRTNQRRIGVHFPTSLCNPSGQSQQRNSTVPDKINLADRFVGFHRQNKRISRFYIYGINGKTASESAMRDYLERENVHVTYLRYFQNRWKSTASAQLNIRDEDTEIIMRDRFWPDGIRMRPWVPREVFIDEHRHG